MLAESTFAEREENNERSSGSRLIKAARLLWPWKEQLLALLICCLAAADYASTVAFLTISGGRGAYEAGVLAGWAVGKGGLPGLLLNDVIAIGLLQFAAWYLRSTCLKNAEAVRFAHAVFVFTLLPYAAVVTAAIINNLLIVFLY